MEGRDLPPAKVLAALEEQTGNLVVDRRWPTCATAF
jgi:hypothetical protein